MTPNPMTQSPLHRHFALADLEWMVMPPVVLNQDHLYHNNGHPVAAVTWAYLSIEAESKLLREPPQLTSDDWMSGDRCWLVDLILPNTSSKNYSADIILKDLQETIFRGQEFWFHRTDLITGENKIVKILAT